MFLLFFSLFLHASAAPNSYEKGPIIVGGRNADPGEYPWMAALMSKSGIQLCGGSLIHPEWVLTAAHCLERYTESQIEVYLGDHVLSVDEGTEFKVSSGRFIMHEEYNVETMLANDIALIHLDSPAPIGEKIQTINLPKPLQEFQGTAIATGWGNMEETGNPADTLQEVEVSLWDDESCRESYGQSAIMDSMLCAGDAGKDSCQRDSGGPLVCDDKAYLCGITSWGYGCGQPGLPGVYAQVSHYIDWIQKHTQI